MERLKPYLDSMHPDDFPEMRDLAMWLARRREANRAPTSGAAETRTDQEERRASVDRRDSSAEREHPLSEVFGKALAQAMYGKGERHGGATIPFLEQPWLKIASIHGNGFLTGQAVKKLEEAVRGKQGEAFEREILGAIVYLGMAFIHHQLSQKEPS